MNAHSLRVLEFDHIISMLRERTACALGDEVAQQLEPSTELLTITESQRETTEAVGIINEDGSMPLGGIHDIRASVGKAALDAMLDPSAFLSIAGTLASGRALRAFIIKRIEKCPKLGEIAVNIGQFQRIEAAVSEAVNDNGEIRDTASPELAAVRSKLRTTHSRLVDKLHSIINSFQYRTMIQDPVVTQRGDRYCIPVKSDYRHAFGGIVHDSSASGATVFIEPATIVDMGNDIKELTAKEAREIERILTRLSGFVKASAGEIKITLDAIARLDFVSAKGRLSCDMDACEPRLNQQSNLDIIHARHPLLKGEVVPIDIELGKRFKALLITGPNTGGKTVTLKTLGLLTLMAQSGLHIPAKSGSEVAIFDQVFADIGDEQSIQQSLSTFSSHMRNIVDIIGSITPNSLILLDEIGAGTDPAEGAALAKAILDTLIQRGARTVATTHYGELKEFAFVRDDVENASVEFDVRTLQPTYRLMIGVPGSSNAYAISSGLGLPAEIVDAAREMTRGTEASEEIIRRIEETHRSATEREQLAERTSHDVEILRSRYEQRLVDLEALKRDLRRQVAEEVDRQVRDKVAELDEIIAEMKTEPEQTVAKVSEGRRRFRRRVKEIRQEIDQLLPDVYDRPDEPFILKKGDRVTVTTLDVDGELLGDPGDADAVVMVGSMKMTIPVENLRPARRPAEKKREEPLSMASRITAGKSMSISPELKLIAQRVEPALANLDKYIDDAYLAGLDSVRIIHGMGTGALKKAVWEYLSNHHAVESYRLGAQNEGGAGATIVKLKMK
jgi:DNA mismatch repair protein MutS2